MGLKSFLRQGMFGYNYRYILTHFWVIPGHVYREIKWFIQRGRRGYSDQDVWNLYYYLLTWLPGAIAILQKDKHGYPVGLSFKRWHKILKDMEKGLRVARRWSELDYPIKDMKRRGKESEKGLDLFRKYFFNLWD